MEIVEANETFIAKDDDFVYGHTKIILRNTDGEYFYAKVQKRFDGPGVDIDVDINSLDMHPIPAEDIWPAAEPRFTRAPNPLPPNSYLKRPRLIHYDENATSKLDYHSLITGEIEACEILREHPHPNIAQYLGCLVEDGLVKGLVFVKYDMTLYQMLDDKVEFDKSSFLDGIKAGVAHMHGLGLIHNDLSPSNIMMTENVPIIIDFDSCLLEGRKLTLTGGTEGWALEGMKYARRENDLYSLSKIEQALMGELDDII